MLAKSAERYFHNYVRGGNKDNRKKQVTRISHFLDWAEETHKVRSLHGLGKRHVIGFWKANRNLSESTRYKYWLGLCKLWAWLGKHEEPPKPFTADQLNKAATLEPEPTDPSAAIKAARETKLMSIEDLAALSAVDVERIEAIESGNWEPYPADTLRLMKKIGIRFVI